MEKISRRTFFDSLDPRKSGEGRRSDALICPVKPENPEPVRIPGADLYELFEKSHASHPEVFSPRNIPSGLDAVSVEGMFNLRMESASVHSSIYKVSPENLVNRMLIGRDERPNPKYVFVPIATSRHLRNNRIMMGLGDVRYNEKNSGGYKENELIKIRSIFANTMLLATTGTLLVSGADISQGISRRKLLQVALSLLTLAGISGLPILGKQVLSDIMVSQANSSLDYNKALSAMYSLTSFMTPEDLNGLFRNIVAAKKIQTLAKGLKEINETKTNTPAIGINWHLGHRSITSLSMFSPSVLRSLILAYPDIVLSRIVEYNNDPQALYGIRVFDMPSNRPNYFEGSKSGQNYNTREADTFKEPRDYVFVDTVLEKELEKRGII